MKGKLIVALFCVFVGSIHAQQFTTFTNKAQFFKQGDHTKGLLPGAFIDINGDLVDDIVSINNGLEYKTFLGNQWDKPLFTGMSQRFEHYFDAFGIAVSDLNGDLAVDYVTGGSFGYIHVLLSNANGYERILLPTPFLVQTINIVDANKDGYPDIYVCNDEGPNTFFINQNGTGFMENKSLINIATTPPSDMSGNYGSVWVDVNLDNLPDLAIAKCKAGVASPEDPRRINALFFQDGSGNFQNRAKEYGFDLGEQSWAVAFGDFDNDGYPDAFVVNHYDPHVMLRNVNGQRFEKMNYADQPVTSFAFQAIARDFDNDGWLDIILSGLEGISFLHNQGGVRFRLINQFSLPMLGMSMTTGDMNDDGFIDIHSHVNEPLNFPGRVSDQLYINQGNHNFYFKCNLESTYAGKSAVGSRIVLYTPEGKQTRQISAGESFGISNSQQVHFGLGVNPHIDSMHVFWPSGHLDVFKELEANQTYFIREKGCIRKVIALTQNPVILDTIAGNTLKAPEGYLSYQWNNKANTQNTFVQKEGLYFVKMSDDKGCTVYSKPIYVEKGCFRKNEVALGLGNEISACSGDPLKLKAVPAKSYVWNTGDTLTSIVITQPGVYTVSATDFCGNVLTDSVKVSMLHVPTALINYRDTVPAHTAVKFVSNDQNTQWVAPDTVSVLSTGTNFIISVLDKDTFVFARTFRTETARSRNIGIVSFPPLNQYGSNAINGGLRFSVLAPLTINHVNVSTDTPGRRKVRILTNQGVLVYEKEFDIRFGHNRLVLQAIMQPGENYLMTTDPETNQKELGFSGPRLLRHFGGEISFPYSIENVLNITESNFGNNYYYYFYDWDVSFNDQTCYSELIRLPVFVDNSVSTGEEIFNQELRIYQNPFMNQLTLLVPEELNDYLMQVTGISGSYFMQATIKSGKFTLDTSAWPAGMYVIKMNGKKKTHTVKVVKQ
jgi:hypothetical protein